MGNPAVTILLTFREAGPLSASLESALGQTFREIEVLVLPEAGAVPAAAEEILARAGDARARLAVPPRPGRAEALNHGMREGKGARALWLQAGDRLERTLLEKCLSALAESPGAAIAYPDCLDPESGAALASVDYDFETLKREEIVPYSALFPKLAWEDVEGFRDNVAGGEAWDFWIACGSRGFLGRRVPQPLFSRQNPFAGSRSESTGQREARIARMRLNNRDCYTPDEIQSAELFLGKSSETSGSASFHSGAKVPLVSVIIPTYNRLDTLQAAIESVNAQTFRDFEIVVVNDAGSHELESLIRSLNRRKNISYVRHGVNRGLGASRNTGIGATRGKYIAYLDDDDFFYPDHLETLVGYLEKTGEKVAYTDAHRIFQKQVDGAYVEDKRDVPYSHDFDYRAILVSNFVPVLCFLHARSCLRETGGFDESLATHEDWDLWIRMSRKFRMNHIAKITSAFTTREDGSNMSARRKHNFMDTTRAIYAKYPELELEVAGLRETREGYLDVQRQSFGLPASAPPVSPAHAEARKLAASGDRSGALALMLSLAVLDAKAALHSDIAVLSFESGDLAQAEAHFRKALQLDPGYVPALKGFGELMLRGKQFHEALESLQAAFRLQPGDKQISLSLASLSDAVGQRDMAEKFYRMVLEIDPDHTEARARLSAGTAAAVPGFPPAGPRAEVSVIIPACNEAERTRDCLRSIAEHYPARLAPEVIVVDNASRDGTSAYLAEASGIYPWLRHVRSGTNEGFARACNRGASMSSARMLVFLDNDTLVGPQWLDKMLERGREGKVGIVGSKLVYPDGTIQHAGIVFNAQAYPHHVARFAPKADPSVSKTKEFSAVTGACLMIPRELFEAVGGFDPEYPLDYEDVDLCFKVRRKGLKVVYEPGSVVVHLEDKSPGTDAVRDGLHQASRAIFFRKWKDFMIEDLNRDPILYASGKEYRLEPA
jgi:GT2 family glycosyltransferase